MFVELHARSAFSFLEAAVLPEELAGLCTHYGMPAMALVDRDGVYGAARFHHAAKKLGVKAHIGSEITCADFISQRRHGGTEKNQLIGFSASPRLRCEEFRLPLLVENRTGYQNLCRLVTRMKLRVPKHAPCAATPEELAEFASGLVCLTGDEHGPLAAALRRGGRDQARRTLERLVAIFGRGNVYVEVARHFDREEEFRNRAAVELASSLGLPLLASNSPRYGQAHQRELLDVFTATRHHTTLAVAGRLLEKNSERHVRSTQEMTALFTDLPDALANTVELSSRLGFTLADLGYEFPRYPVPAGETMMSFLRQRTDEGARRRYRPYTARHRRQIERELGLIEKLDLAGYFLIVWDIVGYCREQGILVQGRGSAANSAVCYSLGITAVDPIGMDLLFERFLSEERGEWPDIDLDLPSGDRRESVIQHVYRRYGQLGAAMTANVITYRGRSAAREIGKALGFSPDMLSRLSSTVGGWEYIDPRDSVERQFHDAGFDLRHARMRKFLQLYCAMQDLPRHLGQHSGGMVICQGQLDSVVPLEPASMPGRVVVQWDKDDCADMGIIKVDLLGLGMMSVMQDCLNLIRDQYGEEVDLAHLPPDDPQVYAALQKADTIGIFQVESRAQMSCLPRLRPRNFYDIVVQVAIIRPGPIVGNMVHPYLKRRNGREAVTYPHPSLEPVLERTLGVPLFQEQLIRMAMIAAGFSGGEAEELRRAFGFKRSEARMKDVEHKLREGMTRTGVTGAAQDEIIHAITSFALYGFPESHAASFALLAYASAWLKCHYLAAFTAAILNNQPMGFYHPASLVKDAQRHGLLIKPIDVTRSDWLCTLEEIDSQRRHGGAEKDRSNGSSVTPRLRFEKDFALRVGLRYVRGLREEAGRALVAAREKAPFTSIDDLARRVPSLRKDELETLAAIGALNSVSSFKFPVSSEGAEVSNSKLHRRDALWQVAKASRPRPLLLHNFSEPDASSPLAPMDVEERLVADYHGTGMTVGPHPMSYRRAQMNELGVLTANRLAHEKHGKKVRVAGCVICRQRPGTAKGFVFLSLEDETGVANAIITPDLYDQYRFLLVSERFLLVEGTLQHQDNVTSVKAEKLRPLQVTAAATSSHDFH